MDNYQSSDLLHEPRKLLSGSWDDNISWEFYLSDYLPESELCTAVFCLAMHSDDQVILTKTKRGWEMLGGHMEPDETVKEALFREAHEEGGYVPQQYKLFGYRKISAKQPVPARDGRQYPFPVSYIPHFIAKSKLPLEDCHGEEVLESSSFPITKLASLDINDISIINAGLRLRNTL